VNKELLDHVDECMEMLHISINLIIPKEVLIGPAGLISQMQIMETVKEDYRKLSDAILALRKERQRFEVSPLTGQLHPAIEDRDEEE